MDWRALLRDRRLWLAGAVAAAGLGAVTFLRRRRSGADDTAQPRGAAPGGVGSPAGVDTTGTDVASWLGQYSGSLQRQLDDYGRTLTESLAAAGQTTRPPGTPNPATSPTTGSLPRTNAAGQYAVGGLNVYDFLRRAGIDMSRLQTLNPTVGKHITWTGAKSPYTPVFTANTFVYAR